MAYRSKQAGRVLGLDMTVFCVGAPRVAQDPVVIHSKNFCPRWTGGCFALRINLSPFVTCYTQTFFSLRAPLHPFDIMFKVILMVLVVVLVVVVMVITIVSSISSTYLPRRQPRNQKPRRHVCRIKRLIYNLSPDAHKLTSSSSPSYCCCAPAAWAASPRRAPPSHSRNSSCPPRTCTCLRSARAAW